METKFKTATKTYNYKEYNELIQSLFEQGRVTGLEQSQEKLDATKINIQRMNRLDKTVIINHEFETQIKLIDNKTNWYLISEGWCGDSAQITPVIAKIAQINPNIELKIILRDDNPEIINEYLTNGGRAIPKLICFDSSNGKEIGTWGPRPKNIQEMVVSFKKENPNVEHEEFVKNLHLWYARDKTQAIQEDFQIVLSKCQENLHELTV